MKIAFVGKGGSGKTTVSSLVARFCASKGFPVMAIDADINQHMARTLGMSIDAVAVPSMGIEIDRIKEYLRGTNPRISDNASMIKTTPPGTGSRLIKVTEKNPIYDYFLKEISPEGSGKTISFMAVGPFDEGDLGVKCYHSKTGSVELLLNHLIDKEEEYVVADMTAGADSFASGLFTRFDITFVIVEPTVKSVAVYNQYKEYARDHSVLIKAIGNKAENEEDEAFLEDAVGSDLVTCLSMSSFIKKTDRGVHVPLKEIETENHNALSKIVSEINSCIKDWPKFYMQAAEFHIKNAKSWANEAVGKDLTKQIDPDFVFSR